MVPRDTRTGQVLESMIIPALERGGYDWRKQQIIGQRIGGHRHKVDVLASKAGNPEIPISLKWQQTSGTTEQKVPFEVISLAELVQKSQGRFKKAYLVLGGEGWSLKEFYLMRGLDTYLRNCEMVEISSLEGFVAKANQGKL
jgi:hypothetical protein